MTGMAEQAAAGALPDDPGEPDDLERALIERARRGDRQAFDRLVERHLERTWRVVWGVLRQREDAEDVVQEVFLAAWRGFATFRGESRFSTWLHRIAVTRALNHLDRAAEKIRRASDPVEAPDEGKWTDPSPSPLQELAASELQERLARCLDKLPGAWRAVVSLRDAEEMSYEGIASALGIALGTVRSRLARARLSLKECIEAAS